jgi:NAD dependent epimerase/dehydratase family enzyme
VNAIRLLIDHREVEGPVNLSAPGALPNEQFMRVLRDAAGAKIGLPASRWMLELGAVFMRTETELILKSRRVWPGRLLDGSFKFTFPDWKDAARELASRWHS